MKKLLLFIAAATAINFSTNVFTKDNDIKKLEMQLHLLKELNKNSAIEKSLYGLHLIAESNENTILSNMAISNNPTQNKAELLVVQQKISTLEKSIEELGKQENLPSFMLFINGEEFSEHDLIQIAKQGVKDGKKIIAQQLEELEG